MNRPKLLIVEDEPPVADAFSALLSKLFEVHTVNSVQAGVESLASDNYAVAVIDLCFPEDQQGGMRIIEYLVEKELTVKAIVLTAYGSIETCREALKSGVFDFIEKGQASTNDRLLAAALEASESSNQLCLDLSKENVETLEDLSGAIGTDFVGVFREAVTILGWAIREWRANRRIASVEDETFRLYPRLLREKEEISR